MKKKLQVFVSSTYTDMLAERQAAVEAILRAGHIPAGMELFASGNESQLETIRRWIDDSDVFMLILGGRYGTIEPQSSKSYIQLEYEYALSQNKPFFAAIISESFLDKKVKTIGVDAIERINGNLLQNFSKMVKTKTSRFFNDANELKLIVFESLAIFERNEGLSGWIRGSDVIDPKSMLEEVSRLQEENISLRKQMVEIEALVALSNKTEYVIGSVGESLSDDAKELLIGAKNGDGYILYLGSIGGATIQAGSTNFTFQHNREEARWKAALDELTERLLVDSVGYKGETFRLTKRGYEAADEIEAPLKSDSD